MRVVIPRDPFPCVIVVVLDVLCDMHGQHAKRILLAKFISVLFAFGFVDRLAFVDFESVEAASSALKNSNGLDVDGRSIKLDYATEKGAGMLNRPIIPKSVDRF